MTYVVLAFLVCFLLIASGLLLAFYREAMGQRLARVLSSRETVPSDRTTAAQSLENLTGYFDKIVPKSSQASTKSSSILKRRLALAGFRQDWHLTAFNMFRILLPIALVAAVVLTKVYESNPFIIIVGVLGGGYLAPDYWLGYRIKARQTEIRLALPDVLDILVVCLEAGLSLDQAVLRTSEEMSSVHPVMADELRLVTLDVRGGRPRIEAWKNLAQRTDVDTVRILVSILVQADQFGTGISRTLRVHSDTLRTRRKQQAEEIAAKTTVKLVFPLVLFIFPSLFIVTLGPAIILFAEGFASL